MQNFKERLYNHESTPPPEIWKNIAAELDKAPGVVAMPSLRRRSKFVFYALTAAASLLIIFIASVFFNKTKNADGDIAASQNAITQQVKDSLKLNNKTLEAIIRSSKDTNLTAQIDDNSSVKAKKYITIEGPEGQPVKISSKAARLIVSADNEYPPKPVWNKKIEKWKQIMLSNTFFPTSTSLLDIAQLSATLDNNE